MSEKRQPPIEKRGGYTPQGNQNPSTSAPPKPGDANSSAKPPNGGPPKS